MQIADITVKANNGSTDVVYTAVQPSSGDGVAAVFQAQAGATTPASRPELRIHAKDGAKGASRVVRMTYLRPQVATSADTSLTSVVNRVALSAELTFPKTATQATIDEAVSQFGNLFVSSVVRGSLKEGYAPS